VPYRPLPNGARSISRSACASLWCLVVVLKGIVTLYATRASSLQHEKMLDKLAHEGKRSYEAQISRAEQERSESYRRSSRPFISVESWMEIASQSNNSIVFLSSPDMLQKSLSTISTPKTFLIADQSLGTVPRNLDHVSLIENHPMIRCVFAKNALYSSSRLRPLPLGPKWQYNSHKFYGEDKDIPWKQLGDLGLKGHPPGQQDLLSRRGILLAAMRLDGERQAAISQIRVDLTSLPHTRNESKTDYDTYLRLLRQHKFVVSPPGKGRDCHRHWEALLVGTSPIVIRERALEITLNGLPVWWVRSYQEVTQSEFERKSVELFKDWQKANIQKLYLEWWQQHINESSCTF
jgi:hypothetical protein